MIDFLLRPASLSSLCSACCTPLSTFPRSWVWPMNWVSAPVHAFLPIYCLQIDHLQVPLHSQLIIAFKCISKLSQSWPPSASPNSRDHGLQVRLQTRLITASKFTRSMASKLVQLRPSSASFNSLNLGLQVHLQTNSITVSKFTKSVASKFVRSWPPSASFSSLDLGLFVHLQTRSIAAPKCISQFTRSRPPNASPNLLDHGLQVHLYVHMFTPSQCISKFSQWASAGAPPITLKNPSAVKLGCMYIYRET